VCWVGGGGGGAYSKVINLFFYQGNYLPDGFTTQYQQKSLFTLQDLLPNLTVVNGIGGFRFFLDDRPYKLRKGKKSSLQDCRRGLPENFKSISTN
jgi:hypothetical protein